MAFQITEVQKALKGVDYPAGKDELADHAERKGAERELVDALPGHGQELHRPTKGRCASSRPRWTAPPPWTPPSASPSSTARSWGRLA